MSASAHSRSTHTAGLPRPDDPITMMRAQGSDPDVDRVQLASPAEGRRPASERMFA